MTAPLTPLSTASQPKSKFPAIFGLALVLAGGVSSAATAVIDHLPNILSGTSSSETGSIDIENVAVGHTITARATAKTNATSDLIQNFGGLTVSPPNQDRFVGEAMIFFDMVIKGGSNALITPGDDITITSLYAKAEASIGLAILVDGAHTNSFANTVSDTIWAQTVSQYTITDPSNVSFTALGNNPFLTFSFNGIEMDITPVP